MIITGSHLPMDRKIDSISSIAKLNLFLRVTGKRSDGYHELLTLFMPLAVPADYITMEDYDGLHVCCDHQQVPQNTGNICHKAAIAYSSCAGLKPDWKFSISKNIPVAAGMGGGSSNAAAVLRMLQSRYNLLSESQLLEIALQLGADVPFFLSPVLATAQGIGEKIRPVSGKFPDLPLVIVNPCFPVSAAWAYQHLNPGIIEYADEDILNPLFATWRVGDFSAMSRYLRNDLAPAVFDKFPVMSIIKRELLGAGALGVEMTGSGPTLFAICNDRTFADGIAKAMQEKYPEFSIWSTIQGGINE